MSDLVKCPHCDNEYANTKLMRALQRAIQAEAELSQLRERVRAAMDNIGVPGPDYPANIAVAYDILNGCLPESQETPLTQENPDD